MHLQNQPLRVLHIDDDTDATRWVAALLRPRGIEVTALHDPSQALERITQENFRVVILDIDFPTMNGLDLLQQIKQADGGTAVIMLTGVVTLSNVLRSMRKGATACLFKPLTDADTLMNCLNEITGNFNRWWTSLKQLSELRRHDGEFYAELSSTLQPNTLENHA